MKVDYESTAGGYAVYENGVLFQALEPFFTNLGPEPRVVGAKVLFGFQKEAKRQKLSGLDRGTLEEPFTTK